MATESKVVAVVQARMTSKRLPGKVLKKLCGRSLIQHIAARLQEAERVNEVVFAIPEGADHQALKGHIQGNGFNFVEGPEEDVLRRFHKAAKEFEADVVVRINSDSPMMSPKLLDKLLKEFDEGGFDYYSNYTERRYPRGFDVEICKFVPLDEAQQTSTDPWEREHVMSYIRMKPDRFQVGSHVGEDDQSHIRLVVSAAEDLELAKKIFEELFPQNPVFELEDVMQLLHQHPDWLKINAKVKHKD